jgi:hypothetical protein
MNDLPRKILCEIIRQNGKTYFEETVAFRGLLNDLCYGNHKKERRCITDSISEGIPSTLLDQNVHIPYEILSAQLTDRLINCGFDRQLARWTVDSWAQALGIISFQINVGNLSVVANPPEAKIFLNDKLMGISPLELSSILPGNYDLKIILSGYDAWQKRIAIPPAQKIQVNANLIKSISHGEIFIDSIPSGAVIFIDSHHLGATPKKITDISLGAHQISLTIPGYEKFSKFVTIQPGKNADLKEKLTSIGPPQTGQIAIDSVPSNADIYFDSVYKGKTPKILKDLSLGSHNIGVKLDNHEKISINSIIHQGKNQDIFLRLTPYPKEPLNFRKILKIGVFLVIAIAAIYYAPMLIPGIFSVIPIASISPQPTPTIVASPQTTLDSGIGFPENEIITGSISGDSTKIYYFDIDNTENIRFIRIWLDGGEFTDYDFIIGKDYVPSFRPPHYDIIEDIGLRTEQYDINSPNKGRYYVVVKNKGNSGIFKISKTTYYK